MTTHADIRRTMTMSHRLAVAGVVVLGLSLATVVIAAVIPIGGDYGPVNVVAEEGLGQAGMSAPDLDALLREMAGRRLIRPSQGLAAVKDSGAASKLLSKLKLQGVVRTTDRLVAYVQIDKQGTKTVRTGDKLLDFVVKDIESGKVTLSLEGVEVSLTH